MITDMVSTGKVNPDELTRLIAVCHFSSEARFLAEQLPEHVIKTTKERNDLLRFTFFDVSIPFTSYTAGRIFQPDTELRWEKQGYQFQVAYIGPERALPPLRVKRDLDLTEKDPLTYYYLFGERLRPEALKQMGASAQQGDFAEVRIPRLLRYPVAENDKRYVRVAIREYINLATGCVELFRFHSLEAVEGKNESI